MDVLLTGIDGYIGSVLASYLLNNGFNVTGLDTGYYREGWLYSDNNTNKILARIINKDLRHIETKDLQGFDAIIHLAELSNDPLGANNPKITHNINYLGSLNLAKLAKISGVKRFIYTSSCSVYGFNNTEILTEESKPDPQTAYAKCKVLVENSVKQLADQNFTPVFLRNATAYGASPRMRFDIVLNNLAGLAQTRNKIIMSSDGSPWRPLVHVLDICKAIKCCLEANKEVIHNQIFNVGHDEDNYQIREIATIVADAFPGCEVVFGKSDGDDRSYRIAFTKINNQLPGFRCDWTARKGAAQLSELFSRIDMQTDIFEFRAFTRLKQLQFLQKTSQIDDEFFWRY